MQQHLRADGSVMAPAVPTKAEAAAPSSWTSGLLQDVQAGLAITCVSIPSAIAYAEVAGLPGVNGLTKVGPALVAHGLSTQVKWLASGTTSLTAVAIATDLGADAYKRQHGMDAYVQLASMYALLVAAASMLLALLRVGSLAKKIPKSVMSGFKWGAAINILASQVPTCVFLAGKRGMATLLAESGARLPAFPGVLTGAVGMSRLAWIFAHPLCWDRFAVAFSAGTMVFVVFGKHIFPKLPPGSEVLLVTAVTTVVSTYVAYAEAGGGVVGQIPEGSTGLVPDLYWSAMPWAEAPRLIVPALIFALVNFSATVAICGAFEGDFGLQWQPNRELFAQGASNMVAGFTGCQPVGGSLTRSLLTQLSGGFSSRVAVVNGLAMMMLLPYFGVIAQTPKAVLASIVLASVIKEVVMPKLRLLKGMDAVLGWSTAVITATTSPTIGIVSGTALFVVAQLVVPTGAAKKDS